MKEDGNNYEPPQKRSTSKQFSLGLIAYFSSIAPSMSLGFSAIALPPLQAEDNPYKLNPDEASWVASIASVATPIGCFLSGPISDRFGRKSALLWINVVTLIGWAVIAVAYYVPEEQYPILLIGRLFTGMSTGLASMPAAVYMAEVSSAKLRGMFTTASAIFFGLGILIVYALGYIFQEDWGTTAFITSVIPCISFILTFLFLPESPSWLVSKNKVSDARNNLRKIFGHKDFTADVNEEIEALVQNRDKSKISTTKKKSLVNTLKKKFKYLSKSTCIKPFIIVTTYFFFQQFSGTFVVIFYAIHIVHEAGVKLDAYAAIILISLTRLLTAILVSYISKKYGRRPMSILSGLGMTFCMLVLTLYLALIKTDYIGEELAENLGWIPMLLLIFYFFTSTIGFLTMPFAINAEVFPAKIRGLATGLVTCIGYSFNFITVKIYPSMVDAMGSYLVFAFYGGMSLLGTIFIVLFLPETKGKTLREIEEYFGKKSETKNDIEIKALNCDGRESKNNCRTN